LTDRFGITSCEKIVVFAPGSSSEEQPTRRSSQRRAATSLLLAFMFVDERFHQLLFLVLTVLVIIKLGQKYIFHKYNVQFDLYKY
ncbi:MAG TPA: hypothetical protein DEO60_00895, partial [Bacteroidales bacterium]|nr:hypothetical protein [Bacteroidales bacterium]